MKKLNFKIVALGAVVIFTVAYSCKKALNVTPAGVLAGNFVANKAGVDGLLIGAYSLLDGYYQGQPGTNYGSGISNWVWGGVGADDAYKGSSTGDQFPDLPAIEQHNVISTSNGYIYSKWQVNYAGIARANSVLQELPLVKDGSETAADAALATAEAIFLRGVYHFELAKVYRNVPYVNEKVTYAAGNYDVPNPGPIWSDIEADFTAAAANLPTTQPQAGRANKYAAEAFLAKALLYDHKYAQALAILTPLISTGTTASGVNYALEPFENNFNASTKNGPESVFAAQMTVNDGSGGQNDDGGDVLNFPGGGTYTGCCGFYVPSYHLADAYQVDENGLPMFQTDATTGFPEYDVNQLPNDHGVAAGAAFTPTSEPVDSRLDWTMGRRNIPYLDWGLCGGEPWTRGDLVPYTPKKNSFFHAAQATTTDNFGTWASNQGSANNYSIIRFADVILWKAECEVMTGALAAAETDVNLIRARAALPSNWVYNYADNSNPGGGYSTTPAANYHVGLYNGQFAANGQSWALQAVMMERQLEFGMEGQRFFDLQRQDAASGSGGPTFAPFGAGYMGNVLNTYYKADNRISNPVLSTAKFTVGRDELYPIPQGEIDIEGGKLVQNPKY